MLSYFARRIVTTIKISALSFALIVLVPGLIAFAQSGHQVINGTQVYTVIDQGRGVATFSNSCGSQELTQRQLQAGAIPNEIIPCPRPTRPSSGTSQPSPSAIRARARIDCETGEQEINALLKDDNSDINLIERTLRTIKDKCSIAGMPEVVARATKATAVCTNARRLTAEGDARKKEATESIDPKGAFDASVMATRAERLYHEGNYQEAAGLLKQAIDTYKAAGQPVVAKDLANLHARAGCKQAIKVAHAAEGTPEDLSNWRRADSSCSRFPDDRQYVARYLAKASASSPAKAPNKKSNVGDCVTSAPTSLGIACDRGGSLTIVATNGCSTPTRIRICLEKRDGSQNCVRSPGLIQLGGTFSHHTCNPSGRYGARPVQ